MIAENYYNKLTANLGHFKNEHQFGNIQIQSNLLCSRIGPKHEQIQLFDGPL